MNLGYRVIYDQDGDILVVESEMEGGTLPRKEITEVSYVDLEFGSIDSQNFRIVAIDVETKEPVLEEVIPVEVEPKVSIEEQILLETEYQTLLLEAMAMEV